MASGEADPVDPDRFLRCLARAVLQIIAERQLDLAHCSACCKIGLQTLRDWRKETYTPSFHSIVKVANGLRLDLREIIDRAHRLYREQG